MFLLNELCDGLYPRSAAGVELEIGLAPRQVEALCRQALRAGRRSGAVGKSSAVFDRASWDSRLRLVTDRNVSATKEQSAGKAGATEEGRVGRRAVGTPAMAELNEGAGRELLEAFVADRCAATRNALVLHYAVCARAVARRVYKAMHADARRLMEREDVEQAAMALLHGLVERYDVTRGIPLSAYVTVRVGHALIDEFRSAGIYVRKERVVDGGPRFVSLDHGRVSECGERKRVQVVDRAAGPVRRLELRGFRRGVLAGVPRELRLVVALRLFRGKQIWQVARRLHVTCAEAQAAFDAAIPYLREALGGGGDDKVTRGQGDKVKRAGTARGVAAAQSKVTRSRGRVVRKAAKPASSDRPVKRAGAKTSGKARVADLVPSHLRREKEFRRWVVLNVPWAYRRFVAYHHLRGLEVERVAEKLGLPTDKARDMERVSKGLVSRAIEAYAAQAA